ncbi:MAG: hypothetical protein ACE5FO_01275 [Parvularculaceae bacterium]
MTPTASEPKSVHDLQALAREAARAKTQKRKGLSRAAHLYLIDVLSRWGGSGLALIAGVSVFIAVTAGRAYPVRTIVWTSMMIVALTICRRLRRAFRSGENIASRPFRWRAGYTASLCVLGASFGAGAVLVLPSGAPDGLVFEAVSLILLGGLGASVLHSAHARSAMAIGLPVAILAFAGAWRAGGPALAAFGAAAFFAASVCAVFLVWEATVRNAAARFPRTSVIRREAGTLARNALSRDRRRGSAAAS